MNGCYSDGRSTARHRCRICGQDVLFDSEPHHQQGHAERRERFVEVEPIYDRDEIFRRWLSTR